MIDSKQAEIERRFGAKILQVLEMCEMETYLDVDGLKFIAKETHEEVKMRQYRVIKDAPPAIKWGQILQIDEAGGMYHGPGYGLAVSIVESNDEYFERVKWKPKEGNTYYCIAHDGAHESYWDDDYIDNGRYKLGNCFRTREEAKAMLEKTLKLWREG